MNANSSQGLRIKITVHKFEAENPKYTAPVHGLFNVNKGTANRLGIGTAYTFPIQKTDKSFQITIKDTATNRSLGSLTMSLLEIFRSNSQTKMHWVTLFEDPDDDIYDGNYTENDEEVPRALISYEVLNLTAEDKANAGWQDKIKNLCKLDGLDSILEIDEETKADVPEPKKNYETKTKKRVHRHTASNANKVSANNDTSKEPPTKDQAELSTENEKLKKAVEKLIEQNNVQYNEINELENKMEGLSSKYQTVIKTYDEEIENLVKEKYELQKKVTSLGHLLENTENELVTTKKELNDTQEKHKIEIKSMEARMKRQIVNYEQQLNELKGDSLTYAGYKGPKEFLQKLIEIENVYSTQVNDMMGKLLQSEEKIAEMVKKMQEKRANEADMKERIRAMEQENESLKSTNTLLESDLKTARTTIEQLENRLLEMEKSNGTEANGIKVIIDQAKNILEIIKDDSTKQKDSSGEDSSLKEQLELLRVELTSKNEILEKDNNSLKEIIKKKEEEVSKLQKELTNAQEQLLNNQTKEEILKEKAKIINSFELLINDYKATSNELKQKNQELEVKLRKATTKPPSVVVEDNDLSTTIDKEDDSEENKYKKELSRLRLELDTEKKKWAERLEEIGQKTSEIDSWRLKSRAKEEKLQELSTKLMQQNKIARELEAQLYQTQQELERSNENSMKIIEEYELMKGELVQRDKEVESLTKLLANCRQGPECDDTKAPQIIYSSDNSDRVDQMFALYINAVRCPVQLKRISEGQYIFGTKKIFAKIQNDKLIIRVGGGFMMIEDFLTTYTAPELNKMKRAIGNDNDSDVVNTSGYKIRKGTDEEFESDQSQSNSFTKGKKSDTRMGLKTASRPIIDKMKTANSRSPTSGMKDNSSRGKILTEQNISNSKMSTDRLTMKKKLLIDEDSENDNIIA